MTPEQAQTFARAKLDQYGLRHWSFGFDVSRNRLGLCNYAKRRVSISRHLLTKPNAEIYDVILHETAHAIVYNETGVNHGHDAVWVAKAREIGSSGRRLGPNMQVARTWKATCGKCSRTYSAHNARPNRACQCDPTVALVWKYDAPPPEK